MKSQPNNQAYSGVDGRKAAGGAAFKKVYGGVDSNAHLSDDRGGAGGYDIKKPYGGVDPGGNSKSGNSKSGGRKGRSRKY
jgi:hypothetical protein